MPITAANKKTMPPRTRSKPISGRVGDQDPQPEQHRHDGDQVHQVAQRASAPGRRRMTVCAGSSFRSPIVR